MKSSRSEEGRGAGAPAARAAVLVALLGGVLGISSASIWIRLLDARGMALFAVAADRMWLATAILAVLLLANQTARGHIRLLAVPRLAILTAVSGAFLAVHFGAWTLSLSDLTVSRSVLLVNSHPIFTAALAAIFLGEYPSRRQVAGIAVSIAGVIILGAPALSAGLAEPLRRGDALALIGAAALSGYLLAGRALRRELSVLAYVVPCYAICAALLTLCALVWRIDLRPPSATAAGLLTLLAVFPTLGGHTVFNWALGHAKATSVSLAYLGEPIGATLLAAIVFGEAPGRQTVAGGAVLLLGVFLASGAKRVSSPES